MAKVRTLLEALPDEPRIRVALWTRRVFGGPSSTERVKRHRNRSMKPFHETDTMVLHETVVEAFHETPIPPPDNPPSHIPASASNSFRTEAVELLNFLNLKAGKSFRPVDSTLRPIIARLRSGVSVQDCKGVIARKIREWKDDPEMKQFLRPETLFGARKFESYLGEKPPPETTDD